ncbi:Dehydrogenase/reductase SDR family member FEY [Bienertia sinuspersici]
MHYIGFIDPEDMNVVNGKRKFTSLVGYSSSKLAQVMFSSVFQKRLPAESGINVVCVSPGIVHTNVARDLSKIVQAAYRLVPYFIFSPQEGMLFILLLHIKIENDAGYLKLMSTLTITGSRSTLFAATDPQILEYCELLKADDWPTCAFISQDCRPSNPSEEAHNIGTSVKVWEKTLEMTGLPLDAVERLIEGEEVICHYGSKKD